MALDDGYGVVIGTLHSHFIDPPDDEGRWPHYHVRVDTPEGIYDCVINLKSRSDIKIEYRDFRNTKTSLFSNILSKTDGFHSLESNASSGAWDFIRHPGMKDPYCKCKFRFGWWFWKKHRCKCTQWWLESGLNVVKLFDYYLQRTHRIYVFGEPYTEGLGMHNVHMNQGDPIASTFADENAIWQDGGILLQYSDPQPRLSIFTTKFQTQSLRTDSSGRPI